jgi:hypothetical protein
MAIPASDGRISDLLAGIGSRQQKAWVDHLMVLHAQLAAIEVDLAVLPPESWNALKRNILRQIDRRRPERGWRQARDLLHEARAFAYLTELGCTEVEFPSPVMTVKSPDLTGRLGTRIVLCEVKTLRLTGTDITRKLRSRLLDAESQLAANGDETALRLIYLVLDRGDSPSGAVDQIQREIAEIARTSIPPTLRVVVDGSTLVCSAGWRREWDSNPR